MIGTTVQHYRVLEEIGRGGMGEVYRAEDTRLGRTVALKFLPASLESDPDRRMRLFREAQAVSRLSSPNIATLYDLGEEGERIFIVMELVRGEPLSRRIARGPLPAPEAAAVAVQIARALAEAHAHGVIHRDVKPSNVMLADGGLVKVLDFGLAKIFEREHEVSEELPTVVIPEQTTPGMIVGTTSYMSPEQALGYTLDARTDVFSLGVVLYEMLTGERPFAGATPMQVVDAIAHAPVPPLSGARADVPGWLERIVRRALEKDPFERYQSARELVAELEAGAAATGTAADYVTRTDAAAARPVPLTERNARRRSNSVAVLAFANIRRDPADDWIGSGIAETVTSDLKRIGSVAVVGRERVSDAIKTFATGAASESDESIAIRVGRFVGAAWIIAGGFQRLGEMLRITARFLDVATGTVVKTIKIDGTLSEIFDLQDRIVRELVDGFDLDLARSELEAIERNETHSIEAYKSFSRGLAELRTADEESFERAIAHLTSAVEIDPAYAMAWAALGSAYCLKGQFVAQRNLVLEALDFERKAIHLDPANAMAYEWLGSGLNYLGRVDEAIEAFEQAVRLDPERPSALAGLGRTQWLGRGSVRDGISSLERAVSLDPNLGYAYLQLGFLYTIEEEFEQAEAACLRAVDLQVRSTSGTLGLKLVGARSRLGYVYYRMKRYEEAIAEYEKEREALGDSHHALRERTLVELEQKLGAASLRLEREEEAEAYFERAVKRERALFAGRAADAATSYYMACLHALRGDAEAAVERLARAVEQLPAITPVRAASDPDLASLRGRPDFQQLVTASRAASPGAE